MDASSTPTAVLPDYITNFSSDAYCRQNYATILPEDRFFIETLTKSSIMTELGIRPGMFQKAIDIGNAGTLIAPAVIAPFVKDGGVLDFADVGSPQIDYIARLLQDGVQGHLGMWQKFEELFSESEPWSGAVERACRLGKTRRAALGDLKPDSYDAGSMMYVSESVNKTKVAFERDTRKFFDAIRPQGLVLWASMIGSEGYNSPGHMFDAVWIDVQDMVSLAEVYLKDFRLLYAAASHGMRPKDGPQYSGAGLIVGIKM